MSVNKKYIEERRIAIGQRIARIRDKHNKTLEEFGEVIDNATKSNVSKWEKGQSLPNRKRMNMIAELDNISLDELLNGNIKEFGYARIKTFLEIKYGDEYKKIEDDLTSLVYEDIERAFGESINYDTFTDEVISSFVETNLLSFDYLGNSGVISNASMYLLNFSNYYLFKQIQVNKQFNKEIDSRLIEQIRSIFQKAYNDVIDLDEKYPED